MEMKTPKQQQTTRKKKKKKRNNGFMNYARRTFQGYCKLC